MKNFNKVFCGLLSGLLILSSTGCDLLSQSNEETVPDQIIRLSVTKDMLLEAAMEEVEVKSVGELYTIGELKTYGDVSFVELLPGDTLKANGSTKAYCRFKDSNLTEALLNAKDYVYIDASLTPISSSKSNLIFQQVSKCITSQKYDDMFNQILQETAGVIVEPEVVAEPIVEETVEGDEIVEEETNDDTLTEAEGEEVEVVEEYHPDEEEEVVQINPIDLTKENLALIEQDYNEYLAQKSTGKIYYTADQLDSIVRHYFEVMNFNQSNEYTLYAKNDGSILGNYTSNQLNAYMCNVNETPADYALVGGYAKLSDMLENVVYKTEAIDNGNGAFSIHIKNNTGKAVRAKIWTSDTDSIEIPENVFDIPFLTESFAITGYYPENEWSNSDIDITYFIAYEFYNSDKELADAFADDEKTLKLSSVVPDEKGKYAFESNYNIIINDLANDVVITSSSKEEETLKAGEVIGVHPEMYRSFKFEIIVPETEEATE